MTLPIRTTFENLSIYIDNLEIEEIKSVNNDVFSTKSKDVGIWHTVVIHPIKDEKGRDFTVPEFQLTPEYFRHGFPD